jgi:hypothetical protein
VTASMLAAKCGIAIGAVLKEIAPPMRAALAVLLGEPFGVLEQ